MAQVYVGNIDPRVTMNVLKHEFQCFGDIRTVWISHKPPGGYAFVEFQDRRDALYAIGAWDGKYGWRVELSRNSRFPAASNGKGRGGGGGGRRNCYNCGETGHFARDCLSASKLDKKGVKFPPRGRKLKDPMASTSAWKPIPPPPPPWLDLPEDITSRILQKLGPVNIIEDAGKVCTTWRRICKDPAMWRVIDMGKLDADEEMLYDLDSICRRAVDLSQGQLTEISIKYFANDELLEYIAQRSGQVRRLRLDCSYNLSSEGFSNAVMKLPLLEELHLQFTPIYREGIEIVGQSCPMLKSFTLNDRGCRRPILICDSEALAVAKTMPELRHLSLFGNKMTNEGLEAILDGCSKLESLDLRQCFNIDLKGELGKRCAQQIKALKCPNDSTSDCAWDTEVFDWVDHDPPGFSDIDSYYDYGDYEDFDYDDFCDPYLFSGGSEDSDVDVVFGFY